MTQLGYPVLWRNGWHGTALFAVPTKGAAEILVIRTGAPWREVPEKYGNWNSIYRQFRRWSVSGVWESVAVALAETMAESGHYKIDSTTVRAHVSAAGLAARRSSKAGRALSGRAGSIAKLFGIISAADLIAPAIRMAICANFGCIGPNRVRCVHSDGCLSVPKRWL